MGELLVDEADGGGKVVAVDVVGEEATDVAWCRDDGKLRRGAVIRLVLLRVAVALEGGSDTYLDLR